MDCFACTRRTRIPYRLAGSENTRGRPRRLHSDISDRELYTQPWNNESPQLLQKWLLQKNPSYATQSTMRSIGWLAELRWYVRNHL